MPELPEVETIVRSLRATSEHTNSTGVTGKTIERAELLWQRSLAKPSIEEFLSLLSNQQILSVNRRGKFLVFGLPQYSLLIHLRMSGDIIVERQDSSRDQKHDRLVLYFTDGSRMAFNDTRKFGRAWLVGDVNEILGKLGPEPLDEALTPELFHGKLLRCKRQIKPLLLDQSFLAGMGNIYTDEALFLAGIHPTTRANKLNLGQAGNLLSAIRDVLSEGIKRNGASIDWVYRGGDFQNHFQVYQRTGQKCFRCGNPIKRILVGQRGTHYCEHCQPIIA